MADHDLAIYSVGKGQVAEELREKIVGLHVVLGFDLALKAIHFVELLSLVVSAAHKEVLWEADLPGEHQHDDFD